MLAIAEDFESNPDKMNRKGLIDTFRNLLVIDGFSYDDDEWRLNVREKIEASLDSWYKKKGEYRRKTKVERQAPNLKDTSPKEEQLWKSLVDPATGPCIWTYVKKTPALVEYLKERITNGLKLYGRKSKGKENKTEKDELPQVDQ